jgi:hypothetical protein
MMLYNFNGNYYCAMEDYGDNNLLLMQMNTGMFGVDKGVEAYTRLKNISSKADQMAGIFSITENVCSFL